MIVGIASRCGAIGIPSSEDAIEQAGGLGLQTG
jgi:hypothetical protein